MRHRSPPSRRKFEQSFVHEKRPHAKESLRTRTDAHVSKCTTQDPMRLQKKARTTAPPCTQLSKPDARCKTAAGTPTQLTHVTSRRNRSQVTLAPWSRTTAARPCRRGSARPRRSTSSRSVRPAASLDMYYRNPPSARRHLHETTPPRRHRRDASDVSRHRLLTQTSARRASTRARPARR